MFRESAVEISMRIKRLTWIDESFRSNPKLPIWHRLIGARASSSVRAAYRGVIAQPARRRGLLLVACSMEVFH